MAVQAEGSHVAADSRARKRQDHKYRHLRVCTEQFRNSLLPQTIPEWNSLPDSCVKVDTVAAFKEQLRRTPSCCATPPPPPPPPPPHTHTHTQIDVILRGLSINIQIQTQELYQSGIAYPPKPLTVRWHAHYDGRALNDNPGLQYPPLHGPVQAPDKDTPPV